LRPDQYVFLEKLHSKFIKGVGKQWRSFHNDKKTAEARWRCPKVMNVSVEELSKRVEELTRFH
jgi:DNA damage-binding protein 1